jgi:hypothetical protein
MLAFAFGTQNMLGLFEGELCFTLELAAGADNGVHLLFSLDRWMLDLI